MNLTARVILVCILLTIGVFTFIMFSETGQLPSVSQHWWSMLLAVIFGVTGGMVLLFTNHQWARILPWNEKRSLRFVAELISGLVIFGLLGLLYYYVYLLPQVPMDQKALFWDAHWDGMIKYLILCSVMLYITSLINFSIYSYNQFAVVQIESLSLRRDQLELKFQALKSQLSPHFLFNALNTISSLTYGENKQAEKYIRNLAATYTFILDHEQQELITLEEELNVVDAFLYMQQVKHQGTIDFKKELTTETMETLVPPLTVQMLIENALKHNAFGKESALTIRLEADSHHLIVSNDKPGFVASSTDSPKSDQPTKVTSFGIGLNNIRKRYSYFASVPVQVEDDHRFTVRLPIIQSNRS